MMVFQEEPSWKTSKIELPPKWPKMAPSWHQNGSKNQPKMGYPIGPGGPKWGTPSAPGAKNSENNIDPTKKREEPNSGAPFCAKKWPTWPKLELKWKENRCKNQSKI